MSDPLKVLLAQPFTRLSRRYLQLLAKGSISLAEFALLVAIADKTVSWKRLWETLSYGDLQETTGLSRQKVADGLAALLNQGRIVRKPIGQSYTYALVPEGWTAAQLLGHCEVDKVEVVVNSVDRHQSSELTGSSIDTFSSNKETPKKGLRPVDKSTSSRGRAGVLVDVGPGEHANAACKLCSGSGWVTMDDGVAYCPCTTR